MEYGFVKLGIVELLEEPMIFDWLLRELSAVGLAPVDDCGTRYGTVTVLAAVEFCLFAERK
jgi:hypothetical protein